MASQVIKWDLSYTHQTTDIALEIRSQEELDQLVAALQSDSSGIVLHNRHRNIVIHIYVRFRE